ncbi:TonB family protein [Hymenobacter sp. BT523]|uniref:energy transducer TonB n=1 Tax=Hymenobacter sp. BT523 TaxID=2795725 RepID=UPI0018EB737F|nr:energy transducer TonB [Hymenobacter sp. BT523]MBJ6109155.1 TonB family protein [Hymenobacter sp. BT523]
MHSRLLLAASMACVAAVAHAQASPPVQTPTPPAETKYFDADHHQIPTEVGAVEKRVTTFRDTVGGTVRAYYLPSGKLKLFAPYADLRHALRHGTASEYFENGQLRFQATYKAGKVVGDLVTYYADGTLKRRDHHAPDQPTSGECFGPDGKPVPYYPYEQMPVYSVAPGDQSAVTRDVQLNTRYPAVALRQGVYGIVKVKFVVGKDGQVKNIAPVEPAKDAVPPKLATGYRALQDAAVSAVQQLKSFAPGRQDGEPVSVSFTVPVTFRIK